jgi:hypothetical protein
VLLLLKHTSLEGVNDLGGYTVMVKNSDKPLTLKLSQRLGTAEGLESPYRQVQNALLKVVNIFKTENNSSYVRNFNDYLLKTY